MKYANLIMIYNTFIQRNRTKASRLEKSKAERKGKMSFPTCHHSLSQTPAVVLCLSVSLVNSPLATSFSQFWCSDLSSCSCGLHEKGTGKWCVLTNCQAKTEGPTNHIYQVRRSKGFLKVFIKYLSPLTLNISPPLPIIPFLYNFTTIPQVIHYYCNFKTISRHFLYAMMCILNIKLIALKIVQWNDLLVLVIPSRNLQDFAADLHKF